MLSSLACGLQPVAWITADGWSVTIHSFTPAPPLDGTFSLVNVTLTCDQDAQAAAAAASAAAGLANPAKATADANATATVTSTRVAACVTANVSSQGALLALLSRDAALYRKAAPYGDAVLPPPSYALHVTLASNISLDAAAWEAARPVLSGPNRTVTLSGDCGAGRTTALDLAGAVGLVYVSGGALLRMDCLELANLATDTARNLPRGLLSLGVWAVDVDTQSGSQLQLNNCTLVTTNAEFVWQSYYVAQTLASASGSSLSTTIAAFLPAFQASVLPSGLQWRYVSSPHTLWHDCTITPRPTVFPTTVPDSFVMRYLGYNNYLSDLLVVHSCGQLLAAVSNASALLPAGPSRPPRSVLLAANISIGDCWPPPLSAAAAAAAVAGGGSGFTGVQVTAASLTLMGLPDRTTTLDLAGRSDAFLLSSTTEVSLRYLTLAGLGLHVEPDDGDSDSDDGAAASIAADTGAASGGSGLELASALMWGFHFPRRVQQVKLEAVTLVLPPGELRQYGDMLTGAAPISYFASLAAFIARSSDLDRNATAAAVPTSTAANTTATAAGASATSVSSTDVGDPQPLVFHTLRLPGIYGSNVSLVSWPGTYGNWSMSMYDVTAGGAHGGGYWLRWRVGVLAAGLVVGTALLLLTASIIAVRAQAARRAASAGGRGSGVKRAARDVEAGGGGGGGGGGGVAGGGAAAGGGAGGGRDGCGGAVERRALYDSFDDPAFELDFFKRGKLSAADVGDILARINQEAAEFNMKMTEILGSGSFAVVYGGYWHDMKCAIKTMVFTESPLPHLGGLRARQQCVRESAFCCTMHHPNVVATHHFYLKSTKRHNMLDDILQRTPPGNNDDEEDGGSRDRRGERRSGWRRLRGAAALGQPEAEQEQEQEGREGRRRLPPPKGGFWEIKPFKPRPVAVTDWRLYLIQEYCDGGTLRQAVDEGKLFRHSGATRGAAADAASAATLHRLPSGLSAGTPTVIQVLLSPHRESLSGGEGGEGGAAAGAAGAGEAAARGAGGDATAAAPISGGGATSDANLVVNSAINGGAVGAAAAAGAAASKSAEGGADSGCEEAADGGGGGGGAMDDLIPILRPACPRGSLPPLPPSTLRGLRAQPTLDSTALGAGTTLESGLLVTSMTNITEAVPAAGGTVPVTEASGSNAGGAAASSSVPSGAPSPPTPAPGASAAAAAAADALPVELSVVVHTALGIASGVAYLHSRSIIHGDLSANNVLLVRTGQAAMPVVPKLSDFGLSMRLPAGQDHLKNVHHGTPYYQSPEVMERGTCSLAADVYSLGVLLWELYHGSPPWRQHRRKAANPKGRAGGRHAAAAAEGHVGAEEHKLGLGTDGAWHDPDYRLRACDVLEVAPHCPNRYARLVRRCLAADPRDRPSARSVVKELLRLERGIAAAASLAQVSATSVPATFGAAKGEAAAGAVLGMASPPAGAVLALTRPQRNNTSSAVTTGAGGAGNAGDAMSLLEDFDAAAAAVAAALARVTAGPAAEGAPASTRAFKTPGMKAATAAAIAGDAEPGWDACWQAVREEAGPRLDVSEGGAAQEEAAAAPALAPAPMEGPGGGGAVDSAAVPAAAPAAPTAPAAPSRKPTVGVMTLE